jgi:hypothetical protein
MTMTVISYPGTDRAWHRPSQTASFLSPARIWISRFRAELNRRQTEKMLESLPADIRKDIGWPTSIQAAADKR